MVAMLVRKLCIRNQADLSPVVQCRAVVAMLVRKLCIRNQASSVWVSRSSPPRSNACPKALYSEPEDFHAQHLAGAP